ncbi:MAG TPA: hypothetical protein VJU86_00445 [Pyrinomonadaceae bacterium]|nr:hypothetical protein [Pyrinomonadaceae bacterium]
MFRDVKLVGVFIYTSGREVEKATNDELRAKYGPPTRTEMGKITPDVGNTFETRNPEWVFPGLHVQYQVIRLPESGRVNLNEGIVWIETESTYQARMAAGNAPVKRKL